MEIEILITLVVSVLALFGLGLWAGLKTRRRRVTY
jgi:hypothetical protein